MVDLKASIAIITNPTFLHIKTAVKCGQLGMNLLIEKPLDMNLDLLSELKDIVNKNRLTAYVAYHLRFHPGIHELKVLVGKEEVWHAHVSTSSWLPEWRSGVDYKEKYSTKKEQGGGVLLDLSHEPDYVEYIFGKIKSIEGVCGKVSNLEIDVEDTADLIMKLDNGKHISVHMDFCSHHCERHIEVTTAKRYYKLDLINNRMFIYEQGKAIEKDYPIERNCLYKAQIDYFVSHIGKDHIMNDLEEASELLKKILAFRNN